MKNADMPAMPTEDICLRYDEVECRELIAESRGLTKREQLAAMAMQGLLANPEVQNNRNYPYNSYIAEASTYYADELLRELEK